jgi:CRP-like cAMP-binding protein
MFEKPVKAGEIVIKQYDNGEEFYVVAHGLFDIFVNDSWVLQVGDGGSFGELALLYNVGIKRPVPPPQSCALHFALRLLTLT